MEEEKRVKRKRKPRRYGKAKVMKRKRVLIIGDSILQGLAVDASTTTLVSIPGATTQKIFKTLRASASLAEGATHVIVHAGTNDLQHKRIDDIINDMDQIIHLLEGQTQGKIFFSGILPRKDSLHAKAMALNEKAREKFDQQFFFCRKMANGRMGDGKPHPEMYKDHLHLSATGKLKLLVSFQNLIDRH